MPGVRQVHNACYSLVNPTPVKQPTLITASLAAAELLDLHSENFDDPELIKLLSGNLVTEDMQPYASCYGGHQFGHWAGQLGDGRAIYLGDIQNQQQQRWEIQLKGAGPTPYSRSADGRAVLRSSIREFICSEAMFHLGVPTTRALSLVTTGDKVLRDMFYDGHAEYEPGAIVCRMAPSFVRFGNFELFHSRKDTQRLQTLADFVIRHHYAFLLEDPQQPISSQIYRLWFEEIARRTATMIIEWMRVGFVHGVMNTDNMSILGLTIDYGPYGWLDSFDPQFTPNTTDSQGRYSFLNQASIAHWNLTALGTALTPLMDDDFDLNKSLEAYVSAFNTGYYVMALKKLGLANDEQEQPPTDSERELCDELSRILLKQETDPTIFYKALEQVHSIQGSIAEQLEGVFAMLKPSLYGEDFQESTKKLLGPWLIKYDQYSAAYAKQTAQATPDSGELRAAQLTVMRATNPFIIPRNYLLQETISAAEQGNYKPLLNLYEALKQPYTKPDDEQYLQKRPEWARNAPGCSALSCSS